MKKRMFLSTILMTLVLLVAVTTATFAWYVVQPGSAGYGSPDSSSIKTTATNGVSVGGVTFSIEFIDEASETLVLTDNSGLTGYMAGIKPVTGLEIPDGQDGYGQFKVKVTANLTKGDETDQEYAARNTPENIKQALAALYSSQTPTKSLLVTLDATSKIRISESSDDDKVYAAAAEGAELTYTINLDSDGATTSWESAYYYFSIKGSDTAEDASTFESEKIEAKVGAGA